MPTTIRLKRVGRKKQAAFRIVVMDSSRAVGGPSIERLGIYNPRTQPSIVKLDAARTLHWLREGAEPSDTVRSILRETGLWERFHQGAAPEDLEEAVVLRGPMPGAQQTSQRPRPGRKAAPTPEPEAEEAPEPEAEEAPEPEAEEAPEAEAGEAPETPEESEAEEAAAGAEAPEVVTAGTEASDEAREASAVPASEATEEAAPPVPDEEEAAGPDGDAEDEGDEGEEEEEEEEEES